MLDIFNLPEHTISSDTKVSWFIWGEKKSGKTTLACSFPKPLLIALEHGYRAISNKELKVVPCQDWNGFKAIVKQLETQAKLVKDGKLEATTFETVIIDSADILYNSLINYVCSLHGVTDLGDTPNKMGYKQAAQLFEVEVLKLIRAVNSYNENLYSVIFISHADAPKEVKDVVTKVKGLRYQPTIDKRANAIIQKHVDVSCMLTTSMDESGVERRYAVFRSPIAEVGSRYPYLPNMVELTYDNVIGAVKDAVAKQIEVDDMKSSKTMMAVDKVEYDFSALMEEAKSLFSIFETSGNSKHFAFVVEKILGVGRRLSDCTEHQAEAIFDVNTELKNKATELGLI